MSKHLFYLLLSLCVIPLYATPSLNVGIYNNPPKIFLDNTQKPSGFFVDILNHIATQNQWQLNYVPCQWQECLGKLEKGEIDIMPDVAYSKEREEKFDFNHEVALSSWSLVYTNKKSTIASILDLHVKRVAVLKNSIQAQTIKADAALFDIQPFFVEVESFQQAFELLRAKKVDAAIVNNFYTDTTFNVRHFTKTSILLNPVILKFAFPKHTHETIIHQLDQTLAEAKHDTNSFFYQAKTKWFESNPSLVLPLWTQWFLAGVFIVFLILVGLIVFFKHLLDVKVTALKEAEKRLIIQSRHAAMGEMISLIAHQWKQPLAVLSMIANNIKMDSERGIIQSEKLQNYYDQLHRQVFYLSHTIDDFRDYFKPNKEKQYVEDVNSIIENALVLIGKSLENHGIEVIKEYGHLPAMTLHTNELIQVLLNILKNASEAFKEHASVKKHILLRTYLRDEHTVCIEIEDNAGGIAPDVQEHIFEPYFTTKSNANGTGLGLYMGKTIIETHFKGTLEVQSYHGDTRFIIALPV